MDKFNDIWKNRFNDGDMPIGDWNTPGDEVWTNLLSEVPVKKDKRRLWLFIFGSLGLLLGLFSYFSFEKSTGNLAEEGTKLESNIDKTDVQANGSVSNIIEDKLNGNQNTTEEGSSEINQNLIKENKNNNNFSTPFKSNKISKATENKRHINSINDVINVRGAQSKAPLVERGELGNTTKTTLRAGIVDSNIMKDASDFDKSKMKLANLSTLPPFNAEQIVFKKNYYNLPSATKIVLKDLDRKPIVNLAVESGAVLWQHKISDQYQSDLAPFDFNYSDDIGWFTGIKAELPINNFIGLFGGIRYEQVQTSSGHNSALAYNANAEETESVNEYELNLATPYGISGASFRFERSEEIENGEVELLVDFNSRHTIRNLNIPFGFHLYPLGQGKRFMPNASIGIGTNYLMSISNNIHSIDTHHDAISYKRDGLATFNRPDLNQWFFDLNFGLGLNYQITNRTQININADWSRGLNPVFEQEDYKTNINRYRLSLGITQRLF